MATNAKVVVIASTNGGMLSALLKNASVKSRVLEVASDRDCGAVEVARAHGVPHTILRTDDALEFSDALAERYGDSGVDVFLCFYTRLLKGRLLSFARNRLVNVHPSILPACPGLFAFENSIRSKSRFIGATLHYIDDSIDAGPPVIQAAVPCDPTLSIAENRHRVFLLQLAMILQFIKWVEEGCITVDDAGIPVVSKARYDIGPFSPNLDPDLYDYFQWRPQPAPR